METRIITGEVLSGPQAVLRHALITTEAFVRGYVTRELESPMNGPVVVKFGGEEHSCHFTGMHIVRMAPIILLDLNIEIYLGFVTIRPREHSTQWTLGDRLALLPAGQEVPISALWNAVGY